MGKMRNAGRAVERFVGALEVLAGYGTKRRRPDSGRRR